VSRLLVAALVLVLPVAASASEGGGGLGHFMWEVANLLLLVGVLVYLARRPVMNYLAERRDLIRNNLETSEKLLADSEARLVEWNRRAAQLDAEIASIREAAHKSAEQEAAAIVAEAHAASERIRTSAHNAVDGELRRARTTLRKEAAQLAVELAANLLREQITDADRDRMLGEFVRKIEGGRG